MAAIDVPKALRTKSQEAVDRPRLFHNGGHPQFFENSSEADTRRAVQLVLPK
jgi:hypothetical protein